MAIAKIKTGDKVKVTAGKFKGIEGIVVDVTTKTRGNGSTVKRAIINEIPTIVKYRKANRAYNMPGQKLEVPRTTDLSNLSLLTEKGELSKVKIEVKDGKKVRVFKKDGSLVPNNSAVSMKAVKEMVKKEQEKQAKEAEKAEKKSKK